MAYDDDARTSWVIRNAGERQRFREIHARLLPLNARMLVLILVAITPAVPHAENRQSFMAALFGVALFALVQRVSLRLPRPELWVLGGLLGALGATIAALAAQNLARSPAVLVCAWIVVGITGRFNDRVALFTIGVTSLMLETAIIAPDPSVIWQSPIEVTLPPVALLAVWTASAVHRDSDLASRDAAIVDQLTGLLNRAALEGRVAEIAHQSRVTGEPVAVIVLDLDHFKQVNDQHGHAVGDAVLRDVAYIVRHELGVHDLAYRIGGEEFAVLLPARDAAAGYALAERIRAAIAERPIAHITVNASLGVASTASGEPFAWDEVFGRADRALYEAKAGGRNRVVVDGAPAPALAA